MQNRSITPCRLVAGTPADSRASDLDFDAPTDLSIKERDDVPVPRFITDGEPQAFNAINHVAPSELLRLSPSFKASSKVEHIVDAAVLRCISEHRSVGTHSRSA
jgi:hypothetical protein